MKPRVLIERIPGIFASLYEKASRMVKDSYYRRLAEEIAGFLKTGSILDLGTGPGYLPLEIAEISPSITVIGLDLSPRLIEMAQDNALKAGVADRIHFQFGSAASLPFADKTFDMVLSTGMLHMVKDPVKIFQEIYRVLKPGSQAWIWDPARVSAGMDKGKWKASLNLWEKMALWLFMVFNYVNPGQPYNRIQVEKIIAQTEFCDFLVIKEGPEIKITLWKEEVYALTGQYKMKDQDLGRTAASVS
jgi:ubiquinone/menaquinone biosynthesis C-methylase UbiE